MSAVKAGGHVICVDSVYGPTRMLFTELKQRFQVETTFVRGEQTSDFENAIRDETCLIYLESPSSVIFRQQDLTAIAALARPRNIVTVCDNSWASPYFQTPLKFGIDMTVHSATKYVGGHSDLVGGLLIGTKEKVNRIAMYEMPLFGATADPFAAWLMLRGLRTLPLRMERHQQNALALAHFLNQHPKIQQVNHPGIADYPQRELTQTQLKGSSGLFSFALKENTQAATFKFIDSLQWFQIGCSWGGFESLAIPMHHPDGMDKHGWLIRMSVGLETAEDLIADVDRALK